MKPSIPFRIFLVDDHPENLQLLEGILEGGSYRLSSFPTGPQALAAARKHPPDLFLLDVMMPEMDGFALCARLQEDPGLKDRPVIFISALHDVVSKSRCFQLGGVDYMTKPFLAEEVRARVATHLRIYAQKKELQQAYAKLCSLEQAREAFVQMLVHDLRSPLTGVTMALQMIQMQMTDASFIPLVDQSLISMEQLKLMVNTLLDYGRLEADAMPVQPRSIELNALIDRLSGTLPLSECPMEIPTGLEAFCDPMLTQRILQNLLSNALKFSAAEAVSLVARREGPFVRVAIHDQGYGISPEEHGVIFTKFGQGSNAGGADRRGFGIGLAFCKLAVETQGGQIGVDSAPGAGSTFWFTLPAEPIIMEETGVCS